MSLDCRIKTRAPVPLDLAFRLKAGQVLALVGPSGAGKTSVLRVIAGLQQADEAQISAAGTVWCDTAARINLPPHRRALGMVFQDYALFPHMNAAANVMAAMAKPDKAEAARLLALVNLAGAAARRPADLSGGEQQRVALARALARKPDVLLLDEPFSAVDRVTRDKLHAEIIALRKHLAMPVILVTHDMAEAQMLADRILLLDKGQMLREGAMDQVMTDPVALRSMGLRAVSRLITAQVAAHEDDGLTRLLTAAGPLFVPEVAAAIGAKVRLRIMAHDVILSRPRPKGLSAQNILPVTVRQVVAGQGPAVMVHLTLGAEELTARVTRRAAADLALVPGDNIYVVLKTMSVARDHLAW
jgi:molybdate transport system ATP-binding protein